MNYFSTNQTQVQYLPPVECGYEDCYFCYNVTFLNCGPVSNYEVATLL